MARSSGFSISIRATDEVTSQVEKINKALFGLGRTAKQVSDNSGPLHRIGVNARATGIVVRELGERGSRALERFGRSAEIVGTKLGAFAPGLSSLTSAATLAGFGELTRRSAEFGGSIVRSSAQIGISTTELQTWQRAMHGAGLSAGDTASMLQNMNKASLEGRALGGPALGIAHRFGINLTGDLKEELLTTADAIKKLHDAGGNPQTELEILNGLGISPQLLDQMEKGRAGIEKLLDVRHQANALSDTDINKLHDLDKGYKGVEDAASSFGSKITADVAGPLTKAAESTGSFLDELRKSPEAMKTVEIGSAALATVLGTGLIVQLGTLAVKLTGIRTLLRSAFGAPLAIGAGLGALGMGINPIPNRAESPEAAANAWRGNGRGQTFMEWWNGTPAPGAAPPQGKPEQPGMIWQRLRHALGLSSAAAAPMPGFATSGPAASRIVQTARASGASNAAITAMFAGALGEGNIHNSWKPGDGGSSFGPWQLHQGGELDRYLREGNKPGDLDSQTRYVLKRLNEIHPGFSQLTDPAVATDVIRQFENSVYSRIPGSTYYSQNIPGAQHVLADVDRQSAAAAPPANSRAANLEILNTLFPGAAVAGSYVAHGGLPPGIKYNSAGQPYELNMTPQERANQDATYAYIKKHPRDWLAQGAHGQGDAAPPVYLRGQEPGARGGADAASENDAGDTKHEVTVHIANAPPGTRTAITGGKGPATVKLRTSYSMAAPF